MFLICECKDMKKIRDGKIYCVKNTQRAEFFFQMEKRLMAAAILP